jgi:sugar phosphate isomerase/epimerase
MIGAREIALANLTILDVSPPDVVDAAAAAGFDSVTLRLAGGGTGDPNPLIGDTRARRETIARLRHHGLGVLDVEVVRIVEDIDLAALGPIFESACALGARHVLVTNQDPDEARAVERFAAICAQAEALALVPALEFMVFTATKRVEQADRIVERAGHPAGRVLVDPLHLQRSGGAPEDVSVLAAAHPERYPYAQLCDAPLVAPEGGGRALYAEAVQNRLAPGDGQLPLAELLEALPAGIPLSIETPVAAVAGLTEVQRARHAMQATRRLLER